MHCSDMFYQLSYVGCIAECNTFGLALQGNEAHEDGEYAKEGREEARTKK